MLFNKGDVVHQKQECLVWSMSKSEVEGPAFQPWFFWLKSHLNFEQGRLVQIRWQVYPYTKKKNLPPLFPYLETKTLWWRQCKTRTRSSHKIPCYIRMTGSQFIFRSISPRSINTNLVLRWAVSSLSEAWQWGSCPVEKWCQILSKLPWMHQHSPPRRLSTSSEEKKTNSCLFSIITWKNYML